MQREQVGVAGDDHVGSSVQGYFQKLVMSRVATFADDLNNGNELGNTSELTQELLAVF